MNRSQMIIKSLFSFQIFATQITLQTRLRFGKKALQIFHNFWQQKNLAC